MVLTAEGRGLPRMREKRIRRMHQAGEPTIQSPLPRVAIYLDEQVVIKELGLVVRTTAKSDCLNRGEGGGVVSGLLGGDSLPGGLFHGGSLCCPRVWSLW